MLATCKLGAEDMLEHAHRADFMDKDQRAITAMIMGQLAPTLRFQVRAVTLPDRTNLNFVDCRWDRRGS